MHVHITPSHPRPKIIHCDKFNDEWVNEGSVRIFIFSCYTVSYLCFFYMIKISYLFNYGVFFYLFVVFWFLIISYVFPFMSGVLRAMLARYWILIRPRCFSPLSCVRFFLLLDSSVCHSWVLIIWGLLFSNYIRQFNIHSLHIA
jgi:hypothetical protein